MNLISTSWTCQRCGAALIGTPPEDGLCPDCHRASECTCPHPEAPLYMCPDAQATCAECGGPVCVRCGQRLMLLVPVSAPTGILAGGREAHDGG